jgi:hypothetical protein
MNERLEQLAEQSGMTQYVAPNNKFLEQFAMLIIHECAGICKDTAEKQFNRLYSRESDGAFVCYQKINDQFGVDQ